MMAPPSLPEVGAIVFRFSAAGTPVLAGSDCQHGMQGVLSSNLGAPTNTYEQQ